MKMSVMSLKEQIIALNIDLEDKIKVGQLLDKRIEKARYEFDKVELVVRERYANSLEDEKNLHKELSEDLTRKTQELVAEKAQLINDLKDRVSEIHQAEHDLQAEIRSLYREAERQLEADRKRFKAGYEERLQKYITLRAQEIKENTSKALEPEFLRLQSMHEREVSECELNYQIEERRLQENLKFQLDGSIEEEKALAKEELKYSMQSTQDKYARELEFKIRDHKVKQRHAQEDYEKEIEKLSAQYQEKLAKYRKLLHQEIQELQQQHQHRVTDLKKSHHLHMENIHQEHDEMMKAIRKKQLKEQKKLESYIREKNSNGEAIDITVLMLLAQSGELSSPTKTGDSLSNSSVSNPSHDTHSNASNRLIFVKTSLGDEDLEVKLMDDTDSDEDIATKSQNVEESAVINIRRSEAMPYCTDQDTDLRARPPISPSRIMIAPPTQSGGLGRPISNSAKRSALPPPVSSSGNSNRGNIPHKMIGGMSFTSPALQERYITSRKETEMKRDRQIQSEIRQLEAETIKLERDLKAKVEHEKQSILSLTKAEETNLCNQAIVLANEITELIKERESLFQIQEEENNRHDRYTQEINDLKNQIQNFRDGISAQRNQLREKEDHLRMKLREIQLEYAPQIRNVKRHFEEIIEAISRDEIIWKEETVSIEKNNAKELANLDASVKSEVSKRDELIHQLRDVIEEDRAKLAKLHAMITNYAHHHGECTTGEDELMILQDSKVASTSGNRSRTSSKTVGGGRAAGAFHSQTESDNQTSYTSRSGATASTASHSRYSKPLHRTSHK